MRAPMFVFDCLQSRAISITTDVLCMFYSIHGISLQYLKLSERIREKRMNKMRVKVQNDPKKVITKIIEY